MLPAFGLNPATRAAALCLAAALATGVTAAQESSPVQPAEIVDLPRYMGRWYVIARLAAPGQTGQTGAHVDYRLREDGRIDDNYYAHSGSFDQPLVRTERVAWVAHPASNAHWKIRTSWPFSDDYLILYVSDEYQYALVGNPARSLGWILAREPSPPEWIYAGLLARLAGHDYDVARMRRVPQTPEQVGQPGFE